MTDSTVVLKEIKEGVLSITLNRPKVNAFNFEMIAETQAAFRQAERDSNVRCVLLSGAGPVFSAGQDVSEFRQAGDISYRAHLQKTYNPLIVQIRRLDKPVIAAVAGSAAGAALGVALACDLRIAADDARFFVGFNGIGLAPDSAVSLFLPLLIGLGRAAEFTFSNLPINAQQALEWGMVNRVVPAGSLAESAFQLARALALGPVQAMGFSKRDFNKAVLPHLEAVLDYEAHTQEIAGHAPEHAEGVSAFLEKRAPRYS